MSALVLARLPRRQRAAPREPRRERRAGAGPPEATLALRRELEQPAELRLDVCRLSRELLLEALGRERCDLLNVVEHMFVA